MPRTLTDTQLANVAVASTRPVFLVEWQHSGSTEYLSCSGSVTITGVSPEKTYTAGGININEIVDGKTATLSLPATSTRITELTTNTWRNGTCKIYAVAGLPGDSGSYDTSEVITLLDGLIDSSSLSGETITVTAKNKYFAGKLVPSFKLTDVSNHVPAVGTILTWEGETITYAQWLASTEALRRRLPNPTNPTTYGRPTTGQTNDFSEQRSGYQPVSGEGVALPIVYGRRDVPGYLFALQEYASPHYLFLGVAWCLGEVYQIEKVFCNDVDIEGSGILARHYRGTSTQAVDPWLSVFVPNYSDDMVFHETAGDLGVCYSVMRIPAGLLSGVPRFRAIIKGRIVEDPTSSSSNSDPYYDNVALSVDFTAGTTDSSQYAHTITLNGDAGISSPSVGLELDGTGDYASVADHSSLRIGAQDFTLEIECSATTVSASPETTEVLISNSPTTSPLTRSLEVVRTGNKLYLYLSSDGSTWDILNGEYTGPITTATFRLIIERVGDYYSTTLDGGEWVHETTSTDLYDSTAGWEIGASNASSEWAGIVTSVRLTTGVARYGSPQGTSNSPFSDSGVYSSTATYSDKPALAWNDLATNTLFGLGATTTGVTEALTWGDTTLDIIGVSPTPTQVQCQIGLAISEVKRAEEWLDMLATYAKCIWFPEGSLLKIRPDRAAGADNGSGDELVTNGVFNTEGSPEDWTKGTGWTISGGVATSSGAQGSPSSLTQTLTTEDGIDYSVSVDITAASTESPQGGITVEFGGVEIISTQKAVGTYTASVTASGTSNDIEVIADTGFNGSVDNVSVRRTKAKVTNWIRSSLSVQPLSETDSPTQVVVQYTVSDDTSGAWKQSAVVVPTVGVAIDGDPIVQTTLDMPGLISEYQAANAGITKLYFTKDQLRISYIEDDDGIKRQQGDVINLVGAYRGIDSNIWVETVTMIDYARWRVTGITYTDNQFTQTTYQMDTTGGPDTPYRNPCGDYNCQALINYFEANNIPYVITYDTSATAMTWPFYTGSETDLYRAYGGTGYYTNWGSGNPTTNQYVRTTITSWNISNEPDFCGGAIQQAMSLNPSPTFGNDYIQPPTGVSNWGNRAFAAVITGFNNSSALSGALIKNGGKRWSFTRGGSGYTICPNDIYVSIGAGSPTSDIYLSILIEGGLAEAGNGTGSVNLGPITDQWGLVTISMTESSPYVQTSVPFPTYSNVCVDVDITATYNGTSVTVSHTYMDAQQIGSNPIVGLTEAGLGGFEPFSFYNCNLTVAVFADYIFTDDDLLSGAVTAYSNNFSCA